MLISKKVKRPSSSFSIENFMLGCLDDKYSLNLSVMSIKHRLEIIRTIAKPFTFKTAHKNVS